MSSPRSRVLALHGVATDPSIWHGLADLLPEMEVHAPQRGCTGDLETEIAALADLAEGAWVIGQSGGATLGLALAARVRMAGALLHEPAVGSLLPGLLAPVRAAFEEAGSAGFAAALYGPTWVRPAELDDAVTARELAMFAGFEPAAPRDDAGPVLVTYGADSPAVRRDAAEALRTAYAVAVEELPGTGHDVAHLNLHGLADRLRRLVATGS
ncbi:MAG: alpha/beta fold hydrolase [Marmoricola sp.]